MGRNRSRKKTRPRNQRLKQDVRVVFKNKTQPIELEKDPWEHRLFYLIALGVLVFILLLWEIGIRD
jgi:hypothetical protein